LTGQAKKPKKRGSLQPFLGHLMKVISVIKRAAAIAAMGSTAYFNVTFAQQVLDPYYGTAQRTCDFYASCSTTPEIPGWMWTSWGGGGGYYTPTSTYGGSSGSSWVVAPNKPLVAGPGGVVNRNTRTGPQCLREQTFQAATAAALARGNVVGRQIMQGSMMGDPGLTAYGPIWLKYEASYTVVDSSGRTVARIVLHYEYNPATGHYTTPPHFVTEAYEGCSN
jgi:hypothetical protein